MLTLHVVQSCINESKHLKQSFGTDNGTTAVYEQETEDATVNDDEVNIFLSGKYEIFITEAVMETMETSSSVALDLLANLKEMPKVKEVCQVEATSIMTVVKE